MSAGIVNVMTTEIYFRYVRFLDLSLRPHCLLLSRYVFGCVCLYVCFGLSAGLLTNYEQIFMKLLPDVCLQPRNNPLSFHSPLISTVVKYKI